jgi:hypothetical protein
MSQANVADNALSFEFLRRRAAFVMAHAVNDQIEAYVVWGAAVDALMRIHARRVGRKLAPNRRCFVDGLLELAPDLGVASLPLLTHELKALAPGLSAQPPLSAYVATANSSRIWRTDEDAAADALTKKLRASQPDKVQRVFDRNRYAEILYEEYRCCAVHGLELGWKTVAAFDGRDVPGYMNYIYGAEDRRPAEYRYRTRIFFPLVWLTQLLEDITGKEERACTAANWAISAYPTLQE